ncbi:uncharacterized protein APUU_20141S [Aspergillus puulaauensis]|uniref:Uncharacterized protein n=1 Tax=Aspergillus puulaauensis TaxID=1220207 RepID=A0A7R7XFH0_9EURO|nr:uncharacterized protein APUU_20141S [Aspergillus puulaauensis]BCS19709.1 hypothetical protein APUU_20141S [Aspergillus puulaauensis]
MTEPALTNGHSGAEAERELGSCWFLNTGVLDMMAGAARIRIQALLNPVSSSVNVRETPSSINSCVAELQEIDSYARRPSDTRRHLRSGSTLNSTASLLNDIRALRVVELINDYRTLLVNTIDQIISIPLNILEKVGYSTLIQSHAALQGLLADAYEPTAVVAGIEGSGNEAAKITYLREVILDASARRHQAQKVYLNVAAVKRWVLLRENVKDSLSEHSLTVRLGEIDAMLCRDIDIITDAPVAARLHEADVRAGYWVEEDPPLTAILFWIQRCSLALRRGECNPTVMQ